MSTRTFQLSDEVHAYLLRETVRESDLLRRLREETAAMPQSNMQISPEQGQFMRLLVELIGARRAIEIGTFTGYSSICIASAMPDDGKLICCDLNRAYTAVAQRYWQQAGLTGRIELRLAPALETLRELRAAGGDGSLDFAFIDADKGNYDAYYEQVLALLRPGGLVAIDNALWSGRVADPAADDAETRALRAINRKVSADARVTASLVPIGDGLLVARKH